MLLLSINIRTVINMGFKFQLTGGWLYIGPVITGDSAFTLCSLFAFGVALGFRGALGFGSAFAFGALGGSWCSLRIGLAAPRSTTRSSRGLLLPRGSGCPCRGLWFIIIHLRLLPLLTRSSHRNPSSCAVDVDIHIEIHPRDIYTPAPGIDRGGHTIIVILPFAAPSLSLGPFAAALTALFAFRSFVPHSFTSSSNLRICAGTSSPPPLTASSNRFTAVPLTSEGFRP